MTKQKMIIGLVVATLFLVGATYIMTIPSEKYDTPRTQGVEQGVGQASPQTTSRTTQTPVKAPVTTTTPKTATSSSSGSTSSSGTSTTTAPTKSTYSMAEVRQHASSSSCWSVVAGGVYDLTSWISRHPGGSGAIKSMCGVDATEEFVDQHGGEGKPEQILGGYKIGFFQ